MSTQAVQDEGVILRTVIQLLDPPPEPTAGAMADTMFEFAKEMRKEYTGSPVRLRVAVFCEDEDQCRELLPDVETKLIELVERDGRLSHADTVAHETAAGDWTVAVELYT